MQVYVPFPIHDTSNIASGTSRVEKRSKLYKTTEQMKWHYSCNAETLSFTTVQIYVAWAMQPACLEASMVNWHKAIQIEGGSAQRALRLLGPPHGDAAPAEHVAAGSCSWVCPRPQAQRAPPGGCHIAKPTCIRRCYTPAGHFLAIILCAVLYFYPPAGTFLEMVSLAPLKEIQPSTTETR